MGCASEGIDWTLCTSRDIYRHAAREQQRVALTTKSAPNGGQRWRGYRSVPLLFAQLFSCSRHPSSPQPLLLDLHLLFFGVHFAVAFFYSLNIVCFNSLLLSVPVCLSVCLSVSLSLSVFSACLPLFLCLCFSVSLLSLSACLFSLSVLICLCVCLSVYRSVFASACLFSQSPYLCL